MVVYLDYRMIAIKGKDKGILEIKAIQADLVKAGFIVNVGKSQWVPTKTLLWLGFQMDLLKGRLTIPEQKVKALTMLVQPAKDDRAICATALASIIKKMVSMGLALGPVTRLKARSLYVVLNTRNSWCRIRQRQLSFRLKHIKRFNGQNMLPKSSAV